MSRPYSNILEKYESVKVAMAEEIYQQGRADAIDEFAKAYKKVETHGCIVCKHLDDDIKCCECISEQLKGKKNE